MEITRKLYKSVLKYNVDYLLIVVGVWMSFFALLSPEKLGGFYLHLIFACGTAIISSFMLKQLGYFDRLRLIPRKGDFCSMLIAMPTAAACQFMLCVMFLDLRASDLSLYQLLAWSGLIGVGSFIVHYAWSWALLRMGRRRKIVLDLTGNERAAVIEELVRSGVDNHLSYLTRNNLKELVLAGKEDDVEMIVISHSTLQVFESDPLLIKAHLSGVSIIDQQDLLSTLTGRVNTDAVDMWTYLRGATPQTPMLRLFLQVKLFIEPLIALALLILFLPTIIVCAILIKLTSPGPVFYKQARTGYLGKTFMMVKFRSMRADAESNGPQWASTNDPRVTPIGRFMRATRLDEIPQLWNVMKREMSFIGPRPERPEIYGKLRKDIPLFTLRTVIRPGITGWAQVSSGYAASVEECRTKLEHDLFYIQHLSPRLDLIIILRTVLVALTGDRQAKKPEVFRPGPIATNYPT